MVTLTERAVAKLEEMMARQNPQPGGLRIGVRGGGCSGLTYAMEFVTQEETAAKRQAPGNDTLYEQKGVAVLVDQMSEIYLDGVTIDYVESLAGAGFKFNNPNTKNTCGCGSSFTV
jgi:iron-sulfur cluster assembly accessory protein